MRAVLARPARAAPLAAETAVEECSAKTFAAMKRPDARWTGQGKDARLSRQKNHKEEMSASNSEKP
jgi:hypothetical protein